MKKTNYHALAWQVSDPIHGSIDVSLLESDVIDSTPFQRLRKIKQLGNVHLVFPGAIHNRFSHSVGAMHLAGKMFDSLFRSIGEKTLQDEKVIELRIIVRLAGLLHDVGHGPFSHTFESCLKRNESGDLIRCLVKDLGPSLTIPKNWIKKKAQAEFAEEVLSHEHYSFGIIKHIFSIIKSPSGVAQDVCSLLDERILPSARAKHLFEDISARLFHGAEANSLRNCIKSLLSGEVDADRLDYLQRDSYYCGVNISSIDSDYILNSIALSVNKGENRNINISLSRSAIPAFEQILVSRKQMFDRVYHHRVNSGFDYIIEYLCNYLLKHSNNEFKYPQSIEDFLPMTDEWLELWIARLSKKDQHVPPDIKLAAQLYVTRSPLKKVVEEDVIDDELDKRLQELDDLHNRNPKADKKLIFFKRLQRLTKLPRDNNTTDNSSIMLKSDSPGAKPKSINLASDILKSNAWREIKSRVFVFESFQISADDRNLSNKI